MPVLKDFRQSKELTLPNYPDSKVVILSGVLFGDAVGMDYKNDVEYVIKILPKLIKEWNFVDEQGNKMPIDGEHLQLLNTDDVEYLVTEIQKFVEEVKKK